MPEGSQTLDPYLPYGSQMAGNKIFQSGGGFIGVHVFSRNIVDNLCRLRGLGAVAGGQGGRMGGQWCTWCQHGDWGSQGGRLLKALRRGRAVALNMLFRQNKVFLPLGTHQPCCFYPKAIATNTVRDGFQDEVFQRKSRLVGVFRPLLKQGRWNVVQSQVRHAP